MARSRFLPLIATVVAGALLLIARLFQVQILEHAVWANEAANLVRSGVVVPYDRGRILDAKGREWARDEKVYEVVFDYRDFRRGHALGQVAHARSALEMRAVSLFEAAGHLESWARELVELSPAGLRRFAAGASLDTGSLWLPEVIDPERDHRATRASDLRFYVAALLDFERADWRLLREVGAEGEDEASFLELFAGWRGKEPDAILGRLEADLDRAMGDLRHWAEVLRASRKSAEGVPDSSPLEELMADLESWRRRVEDATADRLFREATGFSPGRLAPEILYTHVDLEWIARLLRFEPARLEAWLGASRERWLGWRSAWVLPTLSTDLFEACAAAKTERERVDLVLDHLAVPFSGRLEDRVPDWRDGAELTVAAELPGLFQGPSRRLGTAPDILPFQDEALRSFEFEDERSAWRLIGYMALWTRAGEAAEDSARAAERLNEAGAIGERWRALVSRTHRRGEGVRAIEELVVRLEELFQEGIREQLGILLSEAAASGDLSEGRKLRLSPDRLDRAGERARFILKDLSSRPIRVAKDPGYDAIHLATRFPERLAGFTVRDGRVRVAVARDAEGLPLASTLIGGVRTATAVELHEERRLAERLRTLQRKGTRSPQEDRLLEELVREVSRPDEVQGGGGAEGYFDRELRGRNGYRERRGLEERRARIHELYVPPTQGRDVQLTLDMDLQRAAQAVLEHPSGDPDPADCDSTWLSYPVGAIVLMTPAGEVLAAASVPNEVSPEREVFAENPRRAARERAIVRERTLQTPLFQPLGSVFKPFVAAWAVDKLGFDPRGANTCEALDDGWAGYVDMHCWRRFGHDRVDLRGALKGSCNSYFAWLGESFTDEQYIALAREFGFGQPTGVRCFGERSGLLEHTASRVLALHLDQRERRMVANGLGLVEGTPMQLARATAALATGRLPEVRIVRTIGAEPLPLRSRPVDISPGALELVREAMTAVVNEPGGTAFAKQLDPRSLGFSFAAKTGSADTGESIEGVERGVRKHTWVVGWFPAEDPKAVLVVFHYDTIKTASHTAVWVAQQFLSTDAVRNFVAEDTR